MSTPVSIPNQARKKRPLYLQNKPQTINAIDVQRTELETIDAQIKELDSDLVGLLDILKTDCYQADSKQFIELYLRYLTNKKNELENMLLETKNLTDNVIATVKKCQEKEPTDTFYDAEEGPAVEGPAVEGPAVEGPAVEGPAVEGPAVEGPAVAGPVVAGPAVVGPKPNRVLKLTQVEYDNIDWIFNTSVAFLMKLIEENRGTEFYTDEKTANKVLDELQNTLMSEVNLTKRLYINAFIYYKLQDTKKLCIKVMYEQREQWEPFITEIYTLFTKEDKDTEYIYTKSFVEQFIDEFLRALVANPTIKIPYNTNLDIFNKWQNYSFYKSQLAKQKNKGGKKKRTRKQKHKRTRKQKRKTYKSKGKTYKK